MDLTLIRKFRKEKQLTQQELGDLIGVSGAYIQQIECDLKNPSMKILKKLSTVLGVPMSTLCGDFNTTEDIWDIFDKSKDLKILNKEYTGFDYFNKLMEYFGYKVNPLLISSEEEIPLQDYTLDITNLKSGEVKTLNGLEYQQFIERFNNFVDFEFFCINKK